MKLAPLALLICCGLSTQAIAERPAMSERSMPAPEPALEQTAEPAPVTAEPAPIEVTTETMQTGDVLEMQPGETWQVD